MKTKCTICGTKVNQEVSNLLPIDMQERVKYYNKTKNICLDCKKELLYAQIINPF